MRLAIFLTLFVSIILSGCCKPKIIKETVYKDKLVTVACNVPDVNCTWTGNNSMLSANMYTCILNLKEAIKVCQEPESNGD